VKPERRELVFLVRLWLRDAEDLNEPEWRGSIQEIGSGARLYVSGTHDIADFIGSRLADKTIPKH
jgi:hypothetical protein